MIDVRLRAFMAMRRVPTLRRWAYRHLYLRSAHWRAMRFAAIRRAKSRCQSCGARGLLEVHHRTYVRLGGERSSDLEVLCPACHAARHGMAYRATPKWSAPYISATEAKAK